MVLRHHSKYNVEAQYPCKYLQNIYKKESIHYTKAGIDNKKKIFIAVRAVSAVK